MKKLVFISFALFTFIACSKKMTGTSPGAATADNKAKAEAMYTSDIKPLLETKCSPCHFPDQGGNKPSLNNFDSANKRIDEMITRVQLDPSAKGYMPFKGKRDPLTAAEIASLKAWKEKLGN